MLTQLSHPGLTGSGGHSNARKGSEVVYEDPGTGADLSPKVYELKMETCGAYGVLHKV